MASGRDYGSVIALAAGYGSMVSYIALLRISGGDYFATGFGAYQWWIVICGGIGAALGLLIARDRFGRVGIKGMGRAAVGALWVSLIGAVIAGTLALPVYGTMFGPFSLVVTFVAKPVLALVWFGILALIHLMLCSQLSRDSRQAQIAPSARAFYSRLN